MYLNNYIYGMVDKYLSGLQNCEYNSLSSDEIGELKYSVYKKQMQYLLDIEHLKRISEDDLAKRSHLLSLSYHNKPIATCRLTPAPFEISKLVIDGSFDLDRYKHYLEISRLICTNKQMSVNTMIHAGNYGFRVGCYSGFIGLCRKRYTTSFQRFGLKVVHGPFCIHDRDNNEYYIVAATFTTMGIRACGYILQKKVKEALPVMWVGEILGKRQAGKI